MQTNKCSTQIKGFRMKLKHYAFLLLGLAFLQSNSAIADRISNFKVDLKNKDKKTILDSFWSEVKSQEGPFVENISDDPKHMNITFIWREKSPQHGQVSLITDIQTTSTYVAEKMEQIPGTDVWFKTLPTLKGASFYYSFVNQMPNLVRQDPSQPSSEKDHQKIEKFFLSAVSDPFNKKLPQFDPTDRLEFYDSVLKSKASAWWPSDPKFSVLELPGSVQRSWVKAKQIPHGHMEEYLFPVDVVQDGTPKNLKIAVYSPPVKLEKPSPAVILFDGEDVFRKVRLPTVLDNMIADQVIEPLVAVFISTEKGRDDLFGNDRYIHFLAEALVPHLRKKYHVSQDASKIMIGGFSLGGLAATNAGLKRPDIFGLIFRGDGTFPELLRKDDRVETVSALLSKYLQKGNKYRRSQKYHITYSEISEETLPHFDPGYPIEKYRPAFENLAEKLRDSESTVFLKGMPIGHNPLHMQVALHDALLKFFGK